MGAGKGEIINMSQEENDVPRSWNRALIRRALLKATPELVDTVFHEFYNRKGIDNILDECGPEIIDHIKRGLELSIHDWIKENA